MSALLLGLPMYNIAPKATRLWVRLLRMVAEAIRPELAGNEKTRVIQSWQQRKTTDFWRHPQLLLGQACGYPLLTQLATMPEPPQVIARMAFAFPGCETGLYHSKIIVRAKAPQQCFDELANTTAAINSMNSHSGMNALRHLIAQLPRASSSGHFFSHLAISGSHPQSAQWVADGVADTAAIDCITWQLLEEYAPQLTTRLKVLCHSAATPGLPLICAAGMRPRLIQVLRHKLITLHLDHSPLMHKLHLLRFISADQADYQVVLDQKAAAEKLDWNMGKLTDS